MKGALARAATLKLFEGVHRVAGLSCTPQMLNTNCRRSHGYGFSPFVETPRLIP
jgi:hypothetical protein